MYQHYYSPDRCSFLTVECHKYGLTSTSQLSSDHPFKFWIIRALQNLVKLIEGWNKVLFQILKTRGSGVLQMCSPTLACCVCLQWEKKLRRGGGVKRAESSNQIYPPESGEWTARQSSLRTVNFSETAKQGSIGEQDSSPTTYCAPPQILHHGRERRGSGLSTLTFHLATTVPDKPLWILLIPW